MFYFFYLNQTKKTPHLPQFDSIHHHPSLNFLRLQNSQSKSSLGCECLGRRFLRRFLLRGEISMSISVVVFSETPTQEAWMFWKPNGDLVFIESLGLVLEDLEVSKNMVWALGWSSLPAKRHTNECRFDTKNVGAIVRKESKCKKTSNHLIFQGTFMLVLVRRVALFK